MKAIKLHNEVGAFRNGKSYCDQVFILRNIEQCTEWTIITFIDFEKAFKSVQKGSLWNIKAQWDTSNESELE